MDIKINPFFSKVVTKEILSSDNYKMINSGSPHIVIEYKSGGIGEELVDPVEEKLAIKIIEALKLDDAKKLCKALGLFMKYVSDKQAISEVKEVEQY